MQAKAAAAEAVDLWGDEPVKPPDSSSQSLLLAV